MAERDDAEEEKSPSEESIDEFLAQFAGADVQYRLNRLEPKSAVLGGKVVPIQGFQSTFDEPPTLDEIQEAFGGGKFQLQIMKRAPKGNGWQFHRQCSFWIAGPPRLRPEICLDEGAASPPTVQPSPVNAATPIVKSVLDHTMADKRRYEHQLELERQRADRSREEVAVTVLQKSTEQQLDSVRRQLEQSQAELREMRQSLQAKPTSVFGDAEVLKAVFGGRADDKDRIIADLKAELTTLREQHTREALASREVVARETAAAREALGAERDRVSRELSAERERSARELAAERERATRELAAERERATRELEAQRKEHERDKAMIDRLHETEKGNLRAAHAGHLTAKDDQIVRLTEENRRLADDLRTLRENQTPSDPVRDIQRMKTMMDAVEAVRGGAAPVERAEPPDPGSKVWEMVFEHGPSIVEKLLQPRPTVIVAPQSAARPLVPAPTMPTTPARAVVVRPNPAPPIAAPTAPVAAAARAVPPQPSPAETLQQPISNEQRQSTDDAQESAIQADEAVSVVNPAFSTMAIEFLDTALRSRRSAAEVARELVDQLPRANLAALVKTGADALAKSLRSHAPDALISGPAGRRYLTEIVQALEPALATA